MKEQDKVMICICDLALCTKILSYEIFSPQFWGQCTKFFSVRKFLGLQYQ